MRNYAEEMWRQLEKERGIAVAQKGAVWSATPSPDFPTELQGCQPHLGPSCWTHPYGVPLVVNNSDLGKWLMMTESLGLRVGETEGL